MKFGRWLFIPLVILVLVAVAAFLGSESSEKSGHKISTSPQPGSEEHQVDPSSSSDDRVETAGTVQDEQKLVDPEFQAWIVNEAKSIDAVNVDSAKKERELQAKIASLTPRQADLLLQIARNPQAPAREKILSTYMLIGAGELAQRQLAELAATPLEDFGPREPHSEAEMKGVRDKSLRIMAIDGLFARAKIDPKARTELARAIARISDPFLKKYAEDKLRQLN